MKNTLQLTVEVAAKSHERFGALMQSCGASAIPAKGIGNEAYLCVLGDRNSVAVGRAIGRVRDQVFQITIAASNRNDPNLSGDSLKSKIYTAAEQVAGNLF